MTPSAQTSARFVTVFVFALVCAPVLLAQSAAGTSASASSSLSDLPGCTLRGKVYVCSKPALMQALAAAHTVAIVSAPPNHASDSALASLAKSLDKTVVPGTEGSLADLTIRLTPLGGAGVSVGAGTVDLAMLNIFLAYPGNPTGKLLWSETYNGDPDMPWPSVVRALTRQFKGRLGIR